MATATGRTRCLMCDKEKVTFKCVGCLNEYCYNHLGDHKKELNKQLDQIDVHRDLFRQSFTERIDELNNHLLLQQIDKWEQNSIKIIQQTAEEARQVLLTNTNEYIQKIEMKLNKLTNQLKETRQENDFDEINLRQFEGELRQLTKELTKPPHISIQEDFTSFINKISVNVSGPSSFKSNIHYNTRWIQNGFTVAGGNGKGIGLNQLSLPVGIYVDNHQTIYVADWQNHRIVEWKYGATNGQVVAGGNGQGNEINQLNHPSDVIIDKERNNFIICDKGNSRVVQRSRRNGTSGHTIVSNIDCSRLAMGTNEHVYVSDWKKDEVRRWKMNDTCGILVAGGNGKGNRLNQLNCPAFIFVDDDHSVYVSDRDNHRVMKWMEGATEGIVVAGGQGEGNSLMQLACPQGLIVDHLGTIYVADCDNHRIMRWFKGATQGNIIVGGNGQGQQGNQLNGPYDLSFDREGNLFVVDSDNHRVQIFNIDRS